MNKYLKKTKIIATLGPASSSKEVMLGLMRAGVDVFRINFSHADYDLVRSNINIIRDLNKEYGYSVSILGDLQGPKLRVGVVKKVHTLILETFLRLPTKKLKEILRKFI